MPTAQVVYKYVSAEYEGSDIAQIRDNSGKISEFLVMLAIPMSSKSHIVILYVLCCLCQDFSLTKEHINSILLKFCETFDMKPAVAERHIAMGITKAWDFGNMDALIRMFGREKVRSRTPPSYIDFFGSVLRVLS